MTDYKEYAKQMRENAVKNEQGNIVCSPELWEEIASVIERAIVPPCKIGTKVYVITSQTSDNKNLYIFEDIISHYYIADNYVVMGFDNHLGVHSGNWDKVFLTKEEAEEKLKELKCSE